MSKDKNLVILTGRLGADPQTQYTTSGKAMCRFTVASNRTWNDMDGNRQEQVEWFKVVAWEKLAEICGQYLVKGARVLIEGRLQTRSWDDEQTGQKKYMTEVIAEDMIMLDPKSNTPNSSVEADDDLPPDVEPEPVPAPRRQPATAAPVQAARPAPAQSAQQPIRPTGGRRPAPTRTFDDESDLF